VPNDCLLVLMFLLMDITNTIIREFIALVSSNLFGAGVATVVLYAVVAILAPITASLALAFQYQNEKYISHGSQIVLFSQILGGMLFFYGDNISYILTNYGDALGCYELCKEKTK